MDNRFLGTRKFFFAMIFCIFFAGLFFFISAFPSTDDELLFASAAQNLAITGKLEVPQLFGNDRIKGRYRGIAPLHVFFGSIIYKVAELLKSGGLQVLFMLNPTYVALTGVTLSLFAIRRGYSLKISALVGLIFCFITLAFPYAKTFFRELLAMLLMTLSYYFLDGALSSPLSTEKRTFFFFLFIGFFFCAVWTKEYLVVGFPFFVIHFFKHKFNLIDFVKNLRKKKGLFTFVLLFSLISLLMITLILVHSAEGRISFGFIQHVLKFIPKMPHKNFTSAFLGSLISPAKGFFVYSPVLILALLFPLTGKWKSHWNDWVFAMGLTFGMAVLQALAYDADWWSFTWGTRFLLPVIPFWILLLPPLLQMVLSKRNKFLQALILLMLFASLLIQLGGVLISDSDYVAYLLEEQGQFLTGESMWQWSELPFLTYWQMVFSGWQVDIAWLRTLGLGFLPALVMPILCLIIILGGILAYWLCQKGKPYPYQFRITLLLLLLTLMLPVTTLYSIHDDPKYYSQNKAYRDAVSYVSEGINASDIVAVDAYAQPLWYFYFNFGFLQNSWIGLPPAKYSFQRKTVFYPRMDETIQILESTKDTDYLYLISGNVEEDQSGAYSDALIGKGLILMDSICFIDDEKECRVRLWVIDLNSQ
ncbi:MAG TPA: hypothetical protein G4N92_08690 [Anaerolineae bacterium]|nr:hypothetical protein [Anaerolineae bacterium]